MMIFLSKYEFKEYAHNKYGINPIINPIQKNFVKTKILFLNKNGSNAKRGTATRKVFSIKAKPIQIPKSKIPLDF